MSVRSRVIMDDLISETTRKGVGHRVEIEVLTFLWEFAFGRERMMMPKNTPVVPSGVPLSAAQVQRVT